MTYLDRKLSELCTYPGCSSVPLDDNNECRYHQTASCDRKRYWWHFRRGVQSTQLCLVFDVTVSSVAE